MTAFENNPFNNRPRLSDPFNPLLRELLGPPMPIERIELPQLRLPQGDLLVQVGGGGGTGEAGILRRRGEEFAAAIVGQGLLGPSNNRGVSEQQGVELTLMLLNRIHQLNTAAGAQPGSVPARQRINNFIEGINRDLHLRGLDLRVDLTFNDQGAVNVSQALLFRWQNDMRNGDSIGRAHIPQAREQEITQMRERADTFAQQILNGTRLPANGSVPNQTWLRDQLNTHLRAIGTGQGGANRIRLFMLHLGFALRRHNFDVTGPTANQVRFFSYDHQAHSRGLPASPLLAVEVPAPVVNNPGGNAPEQGGEQQTLEQRIATLINQNWQNANNDGAPTTGVAAQFWTAFSQNGEGQFVDRLNTALAGSNHSVAYDQSFHRLILYNGTGNGRTVQRQIDLAIPRPEDARSLTAARAVDAYFNNPDDDGQRSRLLALARQYMQHRLAMPGGAQLFEDSVNQLLQEHRRRVVFNPDTRQFSLHTLGPDNVIVNPPIATVTIPAPEVANPQPMPPVIDERAAQAAARQLATLINGNWQNGNNDATIVAQFQTAFGTHGGQQFITRLNEALAGQNRSVSYNEATRELVLHNGVGEGRTAHRRINVPGPAGEDPLVVVGKWLGVAGLGALAWLYIVNPLRRAYLRHRLATEQIAAERRALRGETATSMEPIREAPTGPRQQALPLEMGSTETAERGQLRERTGAAETTTSGTTGQGATERPRTVQEFIERINRELERPTTEGSENRISPDEVRFFQAMRRNLQSGNAQQRQEALEVMRDYFAPPGENSFSPTVNARLAEHFRREAQLATREGRAEDAAFCTRMSEAFARGTPEQRSWARRCVVGMFGSPRRCLISGACITGGAIAIYVAARQLYHNYHSSTAEQQATPPPEVRGNN